MSNLINIHSNFISQYKSEKVKIGVIVEQPYVVKRNLSGDSEKDTYYDGIFIEILNEILDRQPNWEVSLEYIDYSKQRALEELRAGKFDILIGNISVTEKTKKLSNFTKNVFLNKNVLLYKASTDVYEIFFKALAKNLFYPLFIMFLLIVVFGSILFYVDKKRGRFGSYWATTVGMLGEPGLLAEETNGKLVGMLTAFVIMMSGFYFTMFLQSHTVGEVLDSQNVIDPFLNLDSFIGKTILVPKNFDSTKYLKSVNATVKEYKKIDKLHLVQYFATRDDPTIDGIGISLASAKYWTERYNNIFISGKDMGFKEIVFAVSKDKPLLLDQLNKSIFSLQEGNIIQDKCEKYFPKDAYLCDL